MKQCRRCNRLLPHSAFSHAAHHRDGLASHCKDCRIQHRSEQRRQRRAQRQAEQAAQDAQPTKRCTACKQELPREQFPKKAKSHDGLAPQCKACKAQQDSAARAARSNEARAILKAQQATWYQTHRARILAPKPVDHLDILTTMKVCPQCQLAKPLSAFNRARARADGRRRECRDCQQGNYQDEKATEVGRQRVSRRNRRGHRRYRLSHAETIAHYMQTYRRANPEMGRKHCARRRARKAAAPLIDDIDIVTLYQRDKGICSLCQGKVSLTPQWPDPWSASVEHIIPLAKGGPHAWFNVALAHLRCNMQKHDGIKTQQLRLF